MKRLLLLAIPALFAGGCSTESHLLDSVHTPLVEVSPERSDEDRGSAEIRPTMSAAPHSRAMETWP
jgi:hypothetical protein